MAKKNVIGAWAFLIGVILAVIIGVFGLSTTEGIWAVILVVLGLIIGLLNIGGVELKDFLLAGTVLVVVSAMGGTTLTSLTTAGYIEKIVPVLQALVVLFTPATIVVALKAVFAMAKK